MEFMCVKGASTGCQSSTRAAACRSPEGARPEQRMGSLLDIGWREEEEVGFGVLEGSQRLHGGGNCLSVSAARA